MANGDITKQLTEQVRNELGDLKKELIPTDKIIYRKLSEYQDIFMIEKQVQMVKREFDLRAGDDQAYPIDDDILTIVRAYFEDNGQEVEAKFTINDDDDNRVLVLLPDDENPIEADDVLNLDVYLKAEANEQISDTKDPVINRVYHPWLRRAVLSEYRNKSKEYDFMPIDKVLEHVDQITLKRRMINMSKTITGPRIVNF